jgi:hypothetical protein
MRSDRPGQDTGPYPGIIHWPIGVGGRHGIDGRSECDF